MRQGIAAGVLMMTAMSVGACAAPGERPADVGRAGPAASIAAGWKSCAEAGAPVPRMTPPDVPGGMIPPAGSDQGDDPRLPADFAPVAVTTCGVEFAMRPDGGQDVVLAEKRTEDPAAVATLAAALRLPDLPGTAPACTADALVLPWFVLHDANGAWVRPAVPQSLSRYLCK